MKKFLSLLFCMIFVFTLNTNILAKSEIEPLFKQITSDSFETDDNYDELDETGLSEIDKNNEYSYTPTLQDSIKSVNIEGEIGEENKIIEKMAYFQFLGYLMIAMFVLT